MSILMPDQSAPIRKGILIFRWSRHRVRNHEDDTNRIRIALSIQQQGFVLLSILIIMIPIMMLSMSVTQTALLNTRSARLTQDHSVAFQAAQAALLDAEQEINQGLRKAVFSDPQQSDFILGNCGQDPTRRGLCKSHARKPLWQSVDFSNQSEYAVSVPFGLFTQRVYPSNRPPLPKTAPRYIIEAMPINQTMPSQHNSLLYRITAVGFGAFSESQVYLQSFYRKAIDSDTQQAQQQKSMRLSWREIPSPL